MGFWDGVLFTDEAHMSFSELPDPWILRRDGERQKQQNVTKRTKKTASVVHFAA